MAVRQYIGARYVPTYYQNSLDPTSSEWEANVNYDPLTIVSLPNLHSYQSKKFVPSSVGSPASNPEYWYDQGYANAYYQALQDQIDDMNDGTVPGSLQEQINTNASEISALTNLYDSYINVKSPLESTGLTPVTGDGVTDDTTNLNAIIQYALLNDMNVFFPAGTYKISSITVAFTSSHKTLNLTGVGNESIILSTGNGIIFINGDETSIPNYCKVENLKFYGDNTTNTRLLQFVNIFNGLIQNCLFEHANIGLVLVSNIWGNVINCRFNNCGWDNVYMCGLAEDNRGLYAGNNAVTFVGCVSYGATRDGFECIGNSGCNFYGCTSESNGRCGIAITKSGSFNGRGNLISGCWFEFNPAGCVYIDSTSSATDCNETVSDCGFVWNDTQASNVIGVISTNGAILVSGSHFRRISGTRAAFVESPNLRCIHNRFSYTPTYAEIAGEYVDITHCNIDSSGSPSYKTSDITSVTKTSTGTYNVFVSHWLRSISVTALGTGMTASAQISNQSDGTSYVTVVCRTLSNMSDTDNAFTLIGL